jgi:sterol desaturase/sphingolipid hydroxylase (fatty acid hydroxylase superfamily)
LNHPLHHPESASLLNDASGSGRVSRARIIVAGGLVLFAAASLVVKLLYPFAFITPHVPQGLVHWLLPRVWKLTSDWSLGSMVLYPIAILGIFILERKFPAVPTQKTLSIGLIHDAMWVLVEAAASLVLFHWYAKVLYATYTRHLGFLTLPVPHSMPVLVRLAIGALVLDFGRWWQHWVHHRVPWLWPFHAVHHSQRELNLFSEHRIHIVHYFLRYTLSVLPMLMLNLQEPTVLWWILLLSWHARLYHANIRSNFGPLRYLLVTPQSHRVHHSKESAHFNCNYGATLSIWDYLFGTQFRQYDIYPETGIADETFPTETDQSIHGVLLTPLRQLIHPFRQLWRPAATSSKN